MDILEAVTAVGAKFVYRKDRIPIFDSWRVMKDKGGIYVGDCDDFSITCFWHLHYVKSINDGGHLVGSFQGQWFDNWTKKPLPKADFFRVTKHRYRSIIPGPLVAVYLLLGLVFK